MPHDTTRHDTTRHTKPTHSSRFRRRRRRRRDVPSEGSAVSHFIVACS